MDSERDHRCALFDDGDVAPSGGPWSAQPADRDASWPIGGAQRGSPRKGHG
jgi:hypothetical protein